LDSSQAQPEPIQPEPGVSLPVEKRGVDRRWVFFTLLVLMIAIDQAIKYYVEAHLLPGQWSSWPWPGVLELRLTYNEGIAFGLARGKGGLFTPIALLISIGAGWYSWRHPRDSGWMHTAMALLAAGALGNLYDRLVLKSVRDMFAPRFIDFPVFNWADACITVATAILIIVWTFEAVEAKVKARPAQAKPSDKPSA
jgi:signal peptidase II